MSQPTFIIQGVPICVDPGDDGIILTVGGDSSGLSCATVFLEVSPGGNVAVLVWDQEAEAASSNGNSAEPVRIQLTEGAVPLKTGVLALRQPAHSR